jgi:hypothetical protein
LRAAHWIQKHWRLISQYVVDADRLIWEINGFLLVFKPYSALLDELQKDTASACVIAPLLFQAFHTYISVKDENPIYFSTAHWKSAYDYATSSLWHRTFGGPDRDFILASYAVTPCGAQALKTGFDVRAWMCQCMNVCVCVCA